MRPAIILPALIIGVTATAATATGLGPTPYQGFAQSPYNGQTFSCFFLENFEDHALNTPGVSGDGVPYSSIASFPPSQNDSVDEDDGIIDGNTVGADSYVSGSVSSGPRSITFEFSPTALGRLPTHVGVVWTDGLGNTSFEAFGAASEPLGAIGPVDISDPFVTGETAEDSFFGWIDEAGISRITVSDDFSGLEVDHLQYGFVEDLDADADGVADSIDNCIVVYNPDQRDTDADGIGNSCDADLDNNCVVSFSDLGLLKSVFFSAEPNADFNGDGAVNFTDLAVMKSYFFGAPGPTCGANLCRTWGNN